MKKTLWILLTLIIVIFPLTSRVVYGEKIISQGTIVIDTPINEDLFVTGGDVEIEAEVHGDVFAMGGNVKIDAPIHGDLTVLGGQIHINEDIEGKIIASSGMIKISGNGENIIAACGSIDIHSTAVIQNYGLVAAGRVRNDGIFKGNLNVRASDFTNTGTVEGNLNYKEPERSWRKPLTIYRVLTKIGFLALGVVMMRMFKPVFFTLQKEFEASVLRKGVLGFLIGVASIIITVILAITGIGLPFALTISGLVSLALLFSGILVSYPLGKWITTSLGGEKQSTNDILFFGIGYVVINILYLLPVIGPITRLIISSLGLGITYYTAKNNKESLMSENITLDL